MWCAQLPALVRCIFLAVTVFPSRQPAKHRPAWRILVPIFMIQRCLHFVDTFEALIYYIRWYKLKKGGPTLSVDSPNIDQHKKSALLCSKALSGAPSGTLPRAKERRTVAFLPAGPAAGPSCSRHPMVHQIEPSLKDCNKKRAAISCNAYFGAPSVGALRIQSCGLNLATSPRETNTSACAKCESVPEGMVRQKSRNIRCGFFWCTIGDSNPGPTD